MNASDEQVGGNHYKQFPIQPAEFCQRNQLPFIESCVIKRMCRHHAKGKVDDLKKAIHEIRLIAEIEYGESI